MVVGSAAFTGPFAASTGRVGATMQLVALYKELDAYPQADPWPYFTPTEADSVDMEAVVKARAERIKALRGQFGSNQKKVDDFLFSVDKNKVLRNASDSLGARSFSINLADQLTTTRDLMLQDICWSATVKTHLSWDSHSNNAGTQTTNYVDLFTVLKAFTDDLAAAPGLDNPANTLLDETLVVVLSEMTRTPLLNAENGKDHWPYVTAMLVGGGIKGGHAYGASDDSLSALPVDYNTGLEDQLSGEFVETDQFVAGLMRTVGVDSELYLPGIPAFMPYADLS